MSLLVYLCQLDRGQHDIPTQAAIPPAHNTADNIHSLPFLRKGLTLNCYSRDSNLIALLQPPHNPLPLHQLTVLHKGSKGGAGFFMEEDILDTPDALSVPYTR